ncbi:type IX secretion system anionic LPS delivery protein PorZ [Aegicerativicinus sediminis]|uniref:type IX secretion system anionic LPS delivery protein PorZ n=1 Tax=Aegicerativicinus sediminis TaxID=2893202 RepID=UPI001E37B429|nr:two-component regulator propeller domain-containing protein [Aegicerativicinus sediminis]
MLRYFLAIFFIFISWYNFSQNYSDLWKGYFSYYQVSEVIKGDDLVYAAAENAVFRYNTVTEEIQTITTIEGLSGMDITTIHYSENYDLLMVGYENGLIEIVFESDEDVLSVVDIVEKLSVSPTLKSINHFYEYEGLVYISTDYGISVYDLERLEFGDSYFIGFGGSYAPVNETTVYNDVIYAACGEGNAIKYAPVTNPNLIDYNQWTTIGSGSYTNIQSNASGLYVLNNTSLYRISGNSLGSIYSMPQTPLDFKLVENNASITTQNYSLVFDLNFNQISIVDSFNPYNTRFTSSIVLGDDIFVGTLGYGVLKYGISNNKEVLEIRPDGPLRNDAFKIQTNPNEIWITYGDYTISYNPSPIRSYGISHFKDDTWTNIPFEELLGAYNLNEVAISPFVANEVFISSFHGGILKLNDEEATTFYTPDNSGLESLVVPSDPNVVSVRVSDLEFDQQGLLWSISSRIDNALKSFDTQTGQWRSYSFEDIISDPLNGELGFSDLVIDRSQTKWIGGYFSGVIGVRTESGGYQIKRVNSESSNLPSTVVKALEIDNSGQLWIGTTFGLRVLYNTNGFFEDPNVEFREIVFEDDGIAKELLEGQYITDIKVDGSNSKWIGTTDSGLFYVSPDGQKTIYHFTTTNSPLPSNFITDISLDSANGTVVIATDRGMVSFLSGGSNPSSTLEEAFVYPNPVRPEYDILGKEDLNDINNGIKIKGLTENVNVKITDIEGNLVAECQSRVNTRTSSANYNFAIDGGTAIWNGRNLANNIVATGVYLIMISDLDSFETKVLKLLVVR